MNIIRPMPVKEIVEEWLEFNGFHGLHRDDTCGCDLDDLMPCCEPQDGCSPGYKAVPKDEEDYRIYPTRQAARDAEKGITDDDEN